LLHAGHGCNQHPAFPAPSFNFEGDVWQSSGASCRETAEPCSPCLTESENVSHASSLRAPKATKHSSLPSRRDFWTAQRSLSSRGERSSRSPGPRLARTCWLAMTSIQTSMLLLPDPRPGNRTSPPLECRLAFFHERAPTLAEILAVHAGSGDR